MAPDLKRKLTVLVALCLTGCSCHRAARIDLKPNETLRPHCVGQSTALAASVVDQHGEQMPGAAVTFTSSNPEVAFVDGTGVVTPRKSGTAEILVQSGKAQATVKVEAHVATRLDVHPELTLYAGGGAGIDIHARDEAGKEVAEAPIDVVVSDPKLLTVHGHGVMGMKLGDSSVKVSCGSLSKTIPVHVVLPPFGGIVVEQGPLELTAGTTRSLDFHELHVDGKTPAYDIPLEITSSDPKVVTVDSHGLLQGISPGTATIKLHGGEHNATVDVTVTPSG